MVPDSLSKWRFNQLKKQEYYFAVLCLYPQKYPQPFHAGACFAIQKDLLLVGHLFGVSPIMGPLL